MSLDLDAIRKRLAATTEYDLSAKPAVRGFGDGDAYSGCGGEVLVWSALAETIPPLADFIAAAPGDIAALIEEVETLRSEIAPWQRLVENLDRQNTNMLSEIGRFCRALNVTVKANAALAAEAELLRYEVAQLRNPTGDT